MIASADCCGEATFAVGSQLMFLLPVAFVGLLVNLHANLRQRLTGDGIGQVIQCLVVQGFFYDDRIADPYDNAGRVAVLHACSQ